MRQMAELKDTRAAAPQAQPRGGPAESSRSPRVRGRRRPVRRVGGRAARDEHRAVHTPAHTRGRAARSGRSSGGGGRRVNRGSGHADRGGGGGADAPRGWRQRSGRRPCEQPGGASPAQRDGVAPEPAAGFRRGATGGGVPRRLWRGLVRPVRVRGRGGRLQLTPSLAVGRVAASVCPRVACAALRRAGAVPARAGVAGGLGRADARGHRAHVGGRRAGKLPGARLGPRRGPWQGAPPLRGQDGHPHLQRHGVFRMRHRGGPLPTGSGPTGSGAAERLHAGCQRIRRSGRGEGGGRAGGRRR